MAVSALLRLAIPWRNTLIRLCPPIHEALCRLDFSVRHLPRLMRGGWSSPLPPLLKRAFLRGIARDEGVHTFVETGTYLGDTTWHFRHDFETIHSIEVEPYLHAQAARRFRTLGHITIHRGDSTDVLPAIIASLREKTLYWLDGHYSGGITGTGDSHCPVYAELESIFTLSQAPFVIVIDDARCFGADRTYPRIDDVLACVARLSEQRAAVCVENDMIVIQPSPATA